MKTPRRPGPLAVSEGPAPAGLLAPAGRIARAWAAWRGARVQAAPLVEELEARLMYSADPALAGLALAGAVIEQRLVDDGGEFIQSAPVEQRSRELLIVGAGISDSRTLLDGLARDGRDIDVLELDPASDSMDQISAALAGRHGLSTIHILSHGASGELQLGADKLDAAALAARAGELGRWGDALRAGGDILLYGCDVAAGDAGAAFVRQLSALTGADVAASDNITGSSSLKGDWTFELSTGRIDSTAAFTAAALAQWHGTLEIRVNAVSQDKQYEAAVAVSASGGFVVTWTADHDQDGNKTGIFAQRFDASGNPVGAQTQVNTASQDRQEMSAVGIAADGSFVVAWASHGQQAGDTDGWGIKAQRFAADGSKTGAEFLVNQTTAKDQWQPSIAVAADGQFVIAWASTSGNDIYVRHYSASGNPLRGEVLASGVNGSGSQSLPSVAIAADGSYVVAWETDSGGTARSIYAQRFNSDDTVRGAGFKVNTHDADDQTKPSIAMGGTGAFVIAWTSAKQDGDAGGIYAQRYSADGVRDGSEFRVNTVSAKDQGHASVAMDGTGNFIIAWHSAGEDHGPSTGVHAQRYSAGGAALGGAFLVNSTTAGNQKTPAAAMNSNGTLAIAWEGTGVGDADGVFVAIYNASNTPPIANPDIVSLQQGGQATSAAPGVLANDSDPDSDGTLTVAGLLSPVDGSVLAVTAGGVSVVGLYGTLLIRADGSYVYSAGSDAARALSAGQSGSDVFTYFVSDNNNASASSTLSFTIAGLNDAPVAVNDAYAVDRYQSLSLAAGGVLANDTDADRSPADMLTVVAVNGSAAAVGNDRAGVYGILRLDANGALSYVPDSLNLALVLLPLGESVSEVFTYEVSDGRGGVASATVRITILAGNAAPIASGDSGPDYTLQQDGSLALGADKGVLANDTDPDGNTLTAHLLSGPAHGTLSFNADGSFVYTPNANYHGADSFSYRASDGSLASAPANVTLNIVHVNHAPSAEDDAAAVTASGSTTVDAAHGLLANDRDIDIADQLTVTSIRHGDQHITLSPGIIGSLVTEHGVLHVGSDGAYRYVADGAASMRLGQDAVTGASFSYTISDAQGGESTAWLEIAITGVNDAPVITVGAGAGQTVSDQGSLQPFTGLSITDVDSPEQPLVVRVALDDPGNGMLVGAQGGAYDAASGIYTFTGTAAEATAAVGALIFAPTPNLVTPGLVSTTRFTITADDGMIVATNSGTTVGSTSINDAPVITGASPAQSVSDAASLNPFAAVTIADADSPAQQLIVRVTLDDPARGTLSGATGSYDVATGIYTFTGTAADATGALRALAFTPAANRVAPGSTETTRLTISVSDGQATSTDAGTTVVAASVNDAPSIMGTTSVQFVDDNASLRPFAAVTIGDADSPAQQLTVRVTLDDPARGTLSGATGSYDAYSGTFRYTGTAAQASDVLRALVFTPAANRLDPGASESAKLTLTADDGRASATAVISLSLRSVNDAPVLRLPAGVQTVNDNAVIAPFAGMTVTDADSPAQQLRLRIALDDPAKGRLYGDSGSYDALAGIYTLNGTAAQINAAVQALLFSPVENRVTPGQAATLGFSITVSDGMLGAGGAVALDVLPVNDPPAVLAVSARGTQDRPALAIVLAASDPDGDGLSLVITAAPAHGALYLDAAGSSPLLPGALLRLGGNSAQIYFRAEAGWNGNTAFSYAAVDAHGLAGASAAVSITITPGVRNAAQTTAVPSIEAAAAPAAPSAERAAEPAAAAAPSLAASVTAAIMPAHQPDAEPPAAETVLPAQSNPQPAPAAAPARSSAERGSQAAAAMLGAATAPEAGTGAMLAADLSAAQALADARIERASAAARSETLVRSLDGMRDSIKATEEAEHRIVGSSVAVGAGFSVGYVVWLLRGGVLATSLLSSLPAWRFVDPLPVLAHMRQGGDDEDDTDDSLESLVAGDDGHETHGAARLQPSETRL